MKLKEKQGIAHITISLFLFVFLFVAKAQPPIAKKINAALRLHQKEDTTKVNLLNKLAHSYIYFIPDSGKIIIEKSLQLSEKLNYKKGKAEALVFSSVLLHHEGKSEKGIKLSEESLKISTEIDYQTGIADALKNLGNIYNEIGQFDTSLYYYNKALEINQTLGRRPAISDLYNNIGNLYKNKGNYIRALEYMFDALQLREQLNDSFRIEVTLGNLSGIYYDLKKLDEAEKFCQRARLIQKNLGDLEGLVQTSVTLGSVYSEKGKYFEAVANYEAAIEYAKKLNNKGALAIGLSNLGDVYIKLKLPEIALTQFNNALVLCIETDDIRGISVCETGIGTSLLMLNKIKESIPHLEKGFQLSVKIESIVGQIDAAEQLANAYEKIKEPYKSIEYHKQYKKAKASLFNEETSNKAQEIEFGYLLEKKQNEITLLEKEKSIKEAKDNFIELLIIALIGLIVLLLIIVGLIHKYRIKETKAKELIIQQQAEIVNQSKNLEELNLFKDKTFSILSHDLRAPIANLNGLLQLVDVDLLSGEDFSTMIAKLKEQFKSINLLLENTLNWAKSQMAGELLPAKEMVNISDIVQRNFELFKENLEQKEIETKYLAEPNLQVFVDPNHLDIILRNIILNAIKFSHKKGKVTVEAFEKNNQCLVSISDTGSGMSAEKLQSLFHFSNQSVTYGTAGEKGAGIGLILTQEIASRNDASIHVESEIGMGTTFTIIFPKKPIA